MNQKEFSMRKIDRFSDWLKLFLLYYQSFPPAERKPISIIVSMWKKGKTDIWILVSNGKFAGFASTMNGEKAIMIDY
ncbi:MAG: hypothetical protein IJD86_05445, partial [Clostridia bacterium]|nr:hypothetical protein [Clostridia bacterium]